MAERINGFFGFIQGPFLANEEILEKIQQQCLYQINYISKIGITYTGDYIFNNDKKTVIINDIEFEIGKTKILELENVRITSIKFKEDVSDKFYIDYQYEGLLLTQEGNNNE